MALQAKLLKLLEDRNVRRLGGLRDKQVDVRILAATNCRLEDLIAEGKFRSDLYYRLRVIHVTIPPLRERGGDILLLAQHMLNQHAPRYRKGNIEISETAQQALLNYQWPGNVRELGNMMEQIVLTTDNGRLDADQLHLKISQVRTADIGGIAAVEAQAAAGKLNGDLNIMEMEKRMLHTALERSQGNVTGAARMLGLSRDTLRYRMEKHSIR